LGLVKAFSHIVDKEKNIKKEQCFNAAVIELRGNRKMLSKNTLAILIFLMPTILAPLNSKGENHETSTQLKNIAAQSRDSYSDVGYQVFKESIYKEPFDYGVYIVNGDTPIPTEEMLKAFYDREIVKEWPSSDYGVKLIVDAPGGNIASWDNIDKVNLTYCVSTKFSSRHSNVVKQMQLATKDWESNANVKFVYDPSHDSNCIPSNSSVIFDVRPVNVNGSYLARAFFPRYPRVNRNLLIDESSFNLDPSKNLQLIGILRHEIGHTLGFRHEHTRAESGKCYEDDEWVPISNYDAFSVIHYPQCNGLGDWSLALTLTDSNGVACLYGPPSNTLFNSAICKL